MLRNILGIRIKDKVRVLDIYRTTKAKRVSGTASLLKMRYAGHMIREPREKWNNVMTTWVPHRGKRLRGRPLKRWSDEIVTNFGTNWTNKAKYRQNWKGLVSTHAQKWAAEGSEEE